MLKLGDGHIETQLLFSLLYEYFQIFPVKDFKKNKQNKRGKGRKDGWMFGINRRRINVLRFSNNSTILHMLLLIFRKFFV